MGRTTTSTWGKAIAVTAVVAALAACGGDDDDDAADLDAALDQGSAEATASAAADEFSGAEAAPATAPATAQNAELAGTATPVDIGVVGRDVIIEMYVLLESTDIERSVAAISADAAALGGGIAASNMDFADDAAGGSTGRASLVVKVPPESVDQLLGGLDRSGVVRSINQSAQDVSDQLVDLDVRIANARQSVTNVRQFMESTTNLNELVSLEAELTRRQTELEQLEAQQRNIRDRVELSTITIDVVPPAVATESPTVDDDSDGIGGAFSDGWAAFTSAVLAIVYVLAVMAPFLGLALIITLGLWYVSRRVGERRVIPSRDVSDRAAELPDDELVSSSQRE